MDRENQRTDQRPENVNKLFGLRGRDWNLHGALWPQPRQLCATAPPASAAPPRAATTRVVRASWANMKTLTGEDSGLSGSNPAAGVRGFDRDRCSTLHDNMLILGLSVLGMKFVVISWPCPRMKLRQPASRRPAMPRGGLRV